MAKKKEVNDPVPMERPSDSVVATKWEDLPDCFKQNDVHYYKKNMPNRSPLYIWYQTPSADALKLMAEIAKLKSSFEAKFGKIFV